MGGIICCGNNEPYEISDKESSLFFELKLTKQEIDKLLRSFRDIDVDGSKMIRMDEFFGACRIESTNCNQKIFGIFDSDGSGTLTFSEYVCAMWLFLTLDCSDLGNFLYSLFDTDRSGALDVSEVKNIISLVHQKLLNKHSPIQKLLEELSKRNHKLTSEEFNSWTKSNPSLLEPIFHLHLELRNILIGNHFWETLQQRRYEAGNQTNPRYIDTLRKKLDSISHSKEISNKNEKEKQQKGKKIHPTPISTTIEEGSGLGNGGKANGSYSPARTPTGEKHSHINHKIDKIEKTDEKNFTVIDEGNNKNNNHSIVRKKSDIDVLPRKRSNVSSETSTPVNDKKSDVEMMLNNSFDEPSSDKKHHHHHHGSHHHNHHHHHHQQQQQHSHHNHSSSESHSPIRMKQST